MQGDGNLVLYAPGSTPIWATGIWSGRAAGTSWPGTRRAYGIPQADPGSKMAAEGSDWRTNPQTQIRWGEDYIQSRYGRPCQAWTFWRARAYYGPLLAVLLF